AAALCISCALIASSLCAQNTSSTQPSGAHNDSDRARDGKPNLTPEQLEQLKQRAADAKREPVNIDIVRDVVYATVPISSSDLDNSKQSGAIDSNKPQTMELLMDCASPKNSENKKLPAVIFIHGGGWTEGSRSAGELHIRALANAGYFACTIDYRLAKDGIYPAAVYDCKAAVRFLRAHADDLGIDPNRIGAMGYSAGAHLAALLGTTANEKDLEGNVGEAGAKSDIACVVDISGPTDLVKLGSTRGGARALGVWFGGSMQEKAAEVKQASPIDHIDAHDAPFLIIHGTDDNLVPLEQAQMMRDALKKAGVEVEYLEIEGEGHGVTDPRAMQAAAKFLDAHLGGHLEQTLDEFQALLRDRGGRGELGRNRKKRNDSESAPKKPNDDG
ncbi:MAG TPA: alpha/beta hydrolase, partial [Phycisphaerales bacterium]|nr:alpha/beta hydrolase [Phycisphaerales bacterium]